MNFIEKPSVISCKNLNDFKELRVANFSQNESLDASLQAINLSLNSLQLKLGKFVDKSVKATIQIIYN